MKHCVMTHRRTLSRLSFTLGFCFTAAACTADPQSGFSILGPADPVMMRTDFGDVYVGAPSQRLLSVLNDGDTPIVLDIPQAPPPPFSILGGTCAGGMELQPGDSCTVLVSLTATTVGPVAALLSLTADGGILNATHQLVAQAKETLPDPALALGPASTTAVPTGARLLSTEDFLDGWHQGRLRIEASRANIEGPEVPAEVEAGLTGDTSLYRLLLAKDGTPYAAAAFDLEYERQSRLDAARRFGSHENQLRIYRLLYRQGEVSRRYGMASLREVARKAPEEIRALNAAIVAADQKEALDFGVTPIETPSFATDDCSEDEGVNPAFSGDRSGYNLPWCSRHSGGGIYANFDWPLKAHTRCVKAQGMRGSCVIFANVAAIETEISVATGRRVNLSEQDLYSHFKNWWWPTYYGDGAHSLLTLSQMAATGYLLPFENHWDYNASLWRIDGGAAMTYRNSCLGYSATCSDTAHQAGIYCSSIPDQGLFCGFMSPPNKSGYGFRVTGGVELWDFEDKEGSLKRMKAMLAAKKPLVVSGAVVPSFDLPDANGFLSVPEGTEVIRGGHAYEVVGYVPNETLTAALPGAPEGAGGGYFIAKNSWSVCYGDAGYMYIPDAWLIQNGWSATAIDDVGLE